MQKGKPKEFSSGSLSHLNRITNIMVLKKTELTFSRSLMMRVFVPTKCMCPQDTKSSYYWESFAHIYVHGSSVHNSQVTESAWVPVSRQRKKENVACIYKGLSSSTKKKNNIMLLSGKWTELVITIKWEKQDSERQTPCFPLKKTGDLREQGMERITEAEYGQSTRCPRMEMSSQNSLLSTMAMH